MTQVEAERIIAKLTEIFGVEMDDVTVCQSPTQTPACFMLMVTRNAGGYNHVANTITVSWHVKVIALVHEYTHAVVRHRKLIPDGADNRRAHGREFYAVLREVATAYYGNDREHAWHAEYPHIYRWADADGLVDRPHCISLGDCDQ